jgi:hypothetical protein
MFNIRAFPLKKKKKIGGQPCLGADPRQRGRAGYPKSVGGSRGTAGILKDNTQRKKDKGRISVVGFG